MRAFLPLFSRNFSILVSAFAMKCLDCFARFLVGNLDLGTRGVRATLVLFWVPALGAETQGLCSVQGGECFAINRET
jgi:hypothetical protein